MKEAKAIPIKHAEGFANDLQQVIIFGHDGEFTYITTWGDTPERSAQAAAGANAIKKQWGWPEDTIVESEKVLLLKRRIAQLEDDRLRLETDLARLQSVESAVKPTVHLIQGTEYERGWGQRPDGYVAFLSKEAAVVYIESYNARNNTAKEAPDEYTVYTYIGIHECSSGFARIVAAKKLHHFNKISEMLE